MVGDEGWRGEGGTEVTSRVDSIHYIYIYINIYIYENAPTYFTYIYIYIYIYIYNYISKRLVIRV